MNISQQYQKITVYVLSLLLVVTVISIFLLGLVPPVSRDALTHHLAVPKLYLEHGGIYQIPQLNFSYYPMNLDLLYMFPLYFENDIIPKFIHFLFALLTAGLIYNYLANKLNKLYGLLGALFFLSIPIIIKLSITVYVDLGLIFFTTASLLLLFYWTEKNYQPRYLIGAALCCGLGMGTKYNGMITFFLLSAFTPLLYIRSRETNKDNPAALRYGVYFISIAMLVASPWFIRNYLWTGNPLYPLYQSIFNPDMQHTGHGLDIFSVRRFLFHESPLQILLLPLRIFFEGRDNNPQYFDGILNPFLLLLPFFAFFPKSRHNHIRIQLIILAAFSILFLFIATFQSSMRIRYIAPIIPPMVILSMFGLRNIVTLFRNHAPGRAFAGNSGYVVVGLIVLGMLSYNGDYLIEQFRYVQPLQYISGKITRDAYITRYRPEYPVIRFANHHVDKKTKTLCLFLGNRGYYMDFPHKFYVPTDKNGKFRQLVMSASSPRTIRQSLLKSGYRYILLRNDLITAWVDNLQQHKNTVIFFFQHNLELMYAAGGYSLFQIKKDKI